MTDSLGDFEKEPFSSGGINHDVYRRGSGPAVIVMSEVPGITPKVADFARRVSDRGLTAVMPHMFGTPGRPPAGAYAMETMAKLCISKEFSALATNSPGPIVGWLRALAAAEHQRCGGPGVGAVGMCFTGGYALAMATEPALLAPVLSQPSLPIGGKKAKSTIDISRQDLDVVKRRCANEGLEVLGMRFKSDSFVPSARFRFLEEELGDAFTCVELEDEDANPDAMIKPHSVLTEHFIDQPESATMAALDQVLDLFRRKLQTGV